VVLLAGPTSSIAETDIPLITGRRELTNMAVTGEMDRLDGKRYWNNWGLRNKLFRDVKLSRPVSGSRRFEGKLRLGKKNR
jgi:hypothetical protein